MLADTNAEFTKVCEILLLLLTTFFSLKAADLAFDIDVLGGTRCKRCDLLIMFIKYMLTFVWSQVLNGDRRWDRKSNQR